jgi:hypothetical protein
LASALPVRRAVAVALATLADEREIVAYSGLTGTIDALRGGTYVVGNNRVRFAAARVVTHATADGTLTISRRGARARLRLRGAAFRARCSPFERREERRTSPGRSGAGTSTYG